jgi:hypothetical protein
MKTKIREPVFYLLIAGATIELLLFIWLCSVGQKVFMQLVSAPDTSSYIRIAQHLVQDGILVSSPRTLGYPLFLCLGYLIGGMRYGMYVVIAAQLILNIVFSWVCWSLLQRVTPTSGVRLRAIITLFFFWAGMGMALSLLSDFLAAFFFSVFLYGMLFWRSRSSLLLSGGSLALATLTRPTFTFMPVLLPVAVFLIGCFTSKVPRYHLAVFILCSLSATGVSIAYQYSSYGYVGPSSIVAKNIGRTLSVLTKGKITREDYEEFDKKLAEQAGRPFLTLSRTEEEKYAVQIFRSELNSRPGMMLSQLLKTFVKYLFAPVESSVAKLTTPFVTERTYTTYVRPVLGLVCLPIWLLSLLPPIGWSKEYKMYYILVMMFLFYVVGITVMNPLQGERIRFPVLVFMLPVAVLNTHNIRDYLTQWCQGKRAKERLGVVV